MSDDFGESDDEALLYAATQAESTFNTQNGFAESPRPAKRRRVWRSGEGFARQRPQLDGSSSPQYGDEDGDIDATLDDDIIETLDDKLERLEAEKLANPGKFSKYMQHVPKHQLDLQDKYYTQLPTQGLPSTQPHHIRGAIWHKKPQLAVAEPTPVQAAEDDSGIGLDEEVEARQQVWGANVDNAFDAQKELEGIPSDAFDSSSPAQRQRLAPPANNGNLRQTTLFGRTASQVPVSQSNLRRNWPQANKNEPPTHHKLDPEATKTWIYPTNLGTVRDYQFNIVARGLFHNTLVALPTGLGKTFIAATIMLNWLRWTVDSQIVFVAPTKPLVAQQVEACFGIAGISRSETTMLTGGIAPALREEEWQTKRVFFMTPQTFINDLKLGTCDPKRIVLVVIDEAHRATGAYAYVELVKFIRRFNESFRILALTATPGSDVESVQQVIDGLDISRVEIRTEQSLDIRQYVHTRKIEKMVFDNSDEMTMLMDLFSKVVKPVLTVLNSQNAYWVKDPVELTPFGLTKARQAYMASDAGRHAPHSVKGMVNTIFTILASLSHSMQLLKYHGITPFYNAILGFKNDDSKSKYRKQIVEHKDFATMLQRLRAWSVNPDFVGHPKLSALREVVLNHFMDNGEETRVMIFAHFRDSAEDIVRVLERDKPMVKPHVFNGQAGAKNSEGMTQKKQIEVVQKFKTGQINTLVATSIGEEGLDIGEVDLIICFDSKASPIRMLQRMGRTGRKRQGKIVLFQMRGKEEHDADKAKDSYEKMQEMIADGGRFNFHDDRSRRILPKEMNPEVDKRVIEIPIENSQAGLPTPQKKGRKLKRPTKKFHMPDGVRTGFTKASRVDQEDEDEGGGIDEYFLQGARGQTGQKQTEDPLMQIPSAEEVFLTEADQKACERQYQYVNDEEEDILVSAPRLDAFPERQRTPFRTKFVSHTPRTLTVCDKMRHPADLDGEYPTVSQMSAPPDIIVDDFAEPDEVTKPDDFARPVARVRASAKTTTRKPSGKAKKKARKETPGEAMEGDESSPPPISSAMALPSQGIWLGTADTDGEDEEDMTLDSELADFVVDDAEPVDTVDSSSLPNLSQLQTQTQRGKQQRQSVESGSEESSEDDNALPEVADLVNRNKVSTAAGGKRKRTRVINDSSDEE